MKGVAPEITKQQQSKSINLRRRATVLGAAVGTSVAAVWHKPLIESIVLPAHAQTSTATTFFASAAIVTPIAKNDSLLEMIIPSAYAGEGGVVLSEYTVAVQQQGLGVDSYEIDVFERLLDGSAGEALYRGVVSEASGGTLAVTDNPCDLEAVKPIDVTFESIADDSITMNFTNRNQKLVIPAGTGSLPTPSNVCSDNRRRSSLTTWKRRQP